MQWWTARFRGSRKYNWQPACTVAMNVTEHAWQLGTKEHVVPRVEVGNRSAKPGGVWNE
jgi:hypothetical protein